MKERLKHPPISSEWVKIAKINGIAYTILHSRVRENGWEIERAATQPVRVHVPLKKTPSGCTSRSIAAANGIVSNTFYERLNRGWDAERALNEPPRKWTRFSDEVRVQCERNGIPLQSFRTRIALGWDVERAATQPVRWTKKRII